MALLILVSFQYTGVSPTGPTSSAQARCHPPNVARPSELIEL